MGYKDVFIFKEFFLSKDNFILFPFFKEKFEKDLEVLSNMGLINHIFSHEHDYYHYGHIEVDSTMSYYRSD